MNGPLKDYSKALAEEKKMAVYDDPANGNAANGNGAPGVDNEADAAAVASVNGFDSCGSDDDDDDSEFEDLEVAAAVLPAHVQYQNFQTACLDPSVFILHDNSDTDSVNEEESASAVAPAAEAVAPAANAVAPAADAVAPAGNADAAAKAVTPPANAVAPAAKAVPPAAKAVAPAANAVAPAANAVAPAANVNSD